MSVGLGGSLRIFLIFALIFAWACDDAAIVQSPFTCSESVGCQDGFTCDPSQGICVPQVMTDAGLAPDQAVAPEDAAPMPDQMVLAPDAAVDAQPPMDAASNQTRELGTITLGKPTNEPMAIISKLVWHLFWLWKGFLGAL